MIPAFTMELYQGNNLPVYSGIPTIEAAASAKIEVNSLSNLNEPCRQAVTRLKN